MENGRKISSDDVISKLKDDGDFDKLRLKIIRKLKENEDLRKNIILEVKQSAVFNRPGVENMKPRQLSDAIHQDIGEKVMSQISDSVWEIIRSGDGIKSEVTETVRTVYNRLSNPNEDGESSSRIDLVPVQRGLEVNESVAAPACAIEVASSDIEPNKPPGFAPSELRRIDKHNHGEQLKEEGGTIGPRNGKLQEDRKGETHVEPGSVELSSPPGFPSVVEPKQPDDNSDEDPDVPPGFG